MTKILIIGAGVAGLASALALKKAGLSVEVFEARGPKQCGEGAFLTVGVNGLAALRILNIEPSELGGIDTPRMALYLGDCTHLCEFPTAPERDDGLVAQTVLRADLYQALRQATLHAGIPIFYGKRLTGTDSADGGILARFDDDSQAFGELLVGADGVRSQVRRLIDWHAPEPRYCGLLNIGGVASQAKPADEPGTMKMFFGKRGFFACISGHNRQVWWFANLPHRLDSISAYPPDVECGYWRDKLMSIFADESFPAGQLIAATANIPKPWMTYELPHVPRWYHDRMIIVGDAAHAAAPSSGQGASMAIEDGIELARCLRARPTLSDALAAYERLRRERVEKVVRLGRRNGNGKVPGLLGRAVRDRLLKWWFSRPNGRTLQDLDWLFNHEIEWDTAVC